MSRRRSCPQRVRWSDGGCRRVHCLAVETQKCQIKDVATYVSKRMEERYGFGTACTYDIRQQRHGGRRAEGTMAAYQTSTRDRTAMSWRSVPVQGINKMITEGVEI
jgi:hypothetical protein